MGVEPIERDAVWVALKWKCDILSESYFNQSARCWIVNMISFSVASVQICSGDRGMKVVRVHQVQGYFDGWTIRPRATVKGLIRV